MFERFMRWLGASYVEQLAEANRTIDALKVEADRERNKRAAVEDALVMERAYKPEGVVLTATEQVAVIRTHLDALHGQMGRLIDV